MTSVLIAMKTTKNYKEIEKKISKPSFNTRVYPFPYEVWSMINR